MSSILTASVGLRDFLLEVRTYSRWHTSWRVPLDGFLADRLLRHDGYLVLAGDHSVSLFEASEDESAAAVEGTRRRRESGGGELNVTVRQWLAVDQYLARDRHALRPPIAAANRRTKQYECASDLCKAITH